MRSPLCYGWDRTGVTHSIERYPPIASFPGGRLFYYTHTIGVGVAFVFFFLVRIICVSPPNVLGGRGAKNLGDFIGQCVDM